MNVLDGLLAALVADPLAEDRWSVLADWLEEHDDPRRAELLRLHRRSLATCCDPDDQPERPAWHARIVELLGQGVRPCVPQRTVMLAEGVQMNFSFIPAGIFQMGSPEAEAGRHDDEVRHRVMLTRAFWLAVHPLTRGQWKAVAGTCPGEDAPDDHPARNVSWDDCIALCELAGVKTSWRFRLPTEAEWEHACRAGTTTAYPTGDGPEAMKRAGWCNHDSTWGTGRRSLPGYLDYGAGASPKPVRQFDPNAWGLSDMHGNVWEWCQDWYNHRYRPEGDRVDPSGPAQGTKRVLRGGCYFNDPPQCRSPSRQGFEPDLAAETVGCRICMEMA
jgi:uncharacterized protein (TIGR02996 family)